jgi:16S rRNA (cytidine1402-2'-O)-methyltransferase
MNKPSNKKRASGEKPDIGSGLLILVATPIGNMEDITTRAIRTLRECDLIAAEDTRVAKRLLSFHGLKNRIFSCYDANEEARANEIVKHCKSGKTVALITSRGHPCISDPGYRVVCAVLKAGINVSVAPGPSAAISALALSGFPTDEFHFSGFLPRKGVKRLKRIQAMLQGGTFVIYESPERIAATLKEIAEICGNPQAALSRELTKLHEETIRGTCAEIIDTISQREVLGELTLMVRIDAETDSEISPDIALRGWNLKMKIGLSTKDAALAMSIAFDVPKSKAYEILLKMDKNYSSR